MSLEQEIQQRSFRSENEKLVINILYTYSFLKNRMQAVLKAEGITAQQYNILRILRGQYPEPCSIHNLKVRMLDKDCDASRLIDRLFAKRLVTRKPCQDDRRRQDILISAKGLSLLQRLDPMVSGMYESLHMPKGMARTANEALDLVREQYRMP